MDASRLYDYEREFVVVGDFSDDVVADYAGQADPAEVGPTVSAAANKMKNVMKHVSCPVMSIRADTPGGVTFKVTLTR